MIKRKTMYYTICIGASLLIGFVSSFATMSQITTWYAGLVHPWWTPPNFVFGPVWTVLYVLMGCAAALVWQSDRRGKLWALALFFLHLLVNAAWTLVFFGLEDPVSALLIIKSLWLLIVAMILVFWHYSHKAVYLLLPYVLWVTYAASLNFGIILLN
jgi:tryptophan-rich sensory protein